MANTLCWAKGYCKLYGTEKCHIHCDPFVLLKAIYSQTNLPRKYQYDKPLKPSTGDVDAYRELARWRDEVVEKVNRGENLYIWSSNTGNGKTSWAAKIANHFIRKKVFTGEIENLVVYVSVSKFLEDFRDNYKERDQDFEFLRERMLRAQMLIMDDIGVEKPSEWVQNRLYDIINYRDGEERTIIYTSNVSVEKLGERLDSRIASRVGNSTKIQLVGLDRRVTGGWTSSLRK